MTQTSALARLRAHIAQGGFAPGDRLPPERALTEALGLTRAGLRGALAVLEQEGTIWRHVGKGTFLSGGPETPSLPPFEAVSRELTPVQMMRARLSIEPALAHEAAVNASQEARARIDAALAAAEDAPDWPGYEAADDAFHQAIAAATGNPLLVALFTQLNGVQRAVACQSVVRTTARPPRGHSSFAEHRAIATAIHTRDAPAAHEAMRRHIGSVSGRLFGGI